MARKKWKPKPVPPPDTPTHTGCFRCGWWFEKDINRLSTFVRLNGTKIDVFRCPRCHTEHMAERN